MAYKVCPHCGSSVFTGVIRDVAAFSVTEDDKVEVRKVIEEKREYEIFKCVQCKKAITNDDVKKTAKCSVCGEMVSEDELNEDGVCLACMYINDNKMSTMEALRQLLKQKAEISGPVQAAKKLKAKSKKEEDPAGDLTEDVAKDQTATEEVAEQQEQETPQEAPAEPQKTRRKPKRKTQAPVEEESAEDAIKALENQAIASLEVEMVQEQTEQEAVKAIDDSQAPFPEPPDLQSLSQPGITESVMNDMNAPEGVMNMFADDGSDQAF